MTANIRVTRTSAKAGWNVTVTTGGGNFFLTPRGGRVAIAAVTGAPRLTATDLRRLADAVEAAENGTWQPTPTYDDIVAQAEQAKS